MIYHYTKSQSKFFQQKIVLILINALLKSFYKMKCPKDGEYYRSTENKNSYCLN